MDAQPSPPTTASQLLPVLSLEDVCLFPGASLDIVVHQPAQLAALDIATRGGGGVLALLRYEPGSGPRDLHAVGTLARLRSRQATAPLEQHVELDGLERAHVLNLVGADLLVAEAEPLPEGDEGEEWGAAVEALARYLHAHPQLRGFLESQRRSAEPMGWVNLACQHLPITASARQRLLEATAAERCTKISRGLDALLRKEQQA